MKRIAVVTSTRAEYGLLSPIIKSLREFESTEFKTDLIVTGTHLKESFGKTINEIEYDNVVKVRGMDIVFVTTAKTNDEAYDLLKGFGMPFKK